LPGAVAQGGHLGASVESDCLSGRHCVCLRDELEVN
jgi:hypothetical protein